MNYVMNIFVIAKVKMFIKKKVSLYSKKESLQNYCEVNLKSFRYLYPISDPTLHIMVQILTEKIITNKKEPRWFSFPYFNNTIELLVS